MLKVRIGLVKSHLLSQTKIHTIQTKSIDSITHFFFSIMKIKTSDFIQNPKYNQIYT